MQLRLVERLLRTAKPGKPWRPRNHMGSGVYCMTDTVASARAPLSGWPKAAVDFGPLILFFLANWLGGEYAPDQKLFLATGVFMAAMVVAMAYSWLKTRRMETMLLVTGGLVLVFGGLTLLLKDETFIKIKPTIVYGIFAAVLGYGLITRKPLLKLVMGPALPDMTDEGWTRLTRNWTLFFIGSGILNEVVWRNFSTDIWVALDTWGMVIVSILFTASQLPMILKHQNDPPKDDPDKTDPAKGGAPEA